MTTHALETSDHPFRAGAARVVDVVVLALALPVFIAAGWPLFAWAGVSGAWIFQRVVQTMVQRRARTTVNPRVSVGLMSVSLMGRVWFLMLCVLAIGLIDRESGLPAAVLTAVTFQAWFTGFIVSRGAEGAGR